MKRVLIFSFLFLPVLVFGQEMIDINTANLEQLDALTGIGPAYAQRIIDARPFSSVDDLLKVSGIGEKTLQKIKEQGLAYVSYQQVAPTPEPEPTPASTPPIVQTSTPSYPGGIIISEIMPSPEGSDEENEYIKLQNKNNFEVDLTGWTLRDKQGSVKEYVLTQKIPGYGSLALLRPQTGITLNNSGDGVELLNPLKEVVDSVDFSKAETGIAFIKTASGWQWDTTQPAQTTTISQKKQDNKMPLLQAQTKEGIEEINISSKNKTSKFSFYLTGVFIAFLFSFLFLVLKRKLSQTTLEIK
jgi:competence ComEA-like helix-hairpin-helix protein